jgi:hypothetical protein
VQAVTRDMDLVREVLIAIEQDPAFDGLCQMQPDGPNPLGISDFSFAQVAYHLALLIDAGMVVGKSGMRMPIITRLTWQGHEFCDTVRDPAIWAKTKKGASAAGGFTIDLLKDLAKGFLKTQIEERTGVKL